LTGYALEAETMKLNDLKRKHNALQKEARELYVKVQGMTVEINDLRGRIQAIEGEDYDEIPLIFGGDMHLYDDGEEAEVHNVKSTPKTTVDRLLD